MNLRTKAVANVGFYGGVSGIVTAAVALITLWSNTTYDYNLLLSVEKLHNHQTLLQADMMTILQTVAAVIGLLGACLLFLFLAWIGKSPLAPPAPPENGNPT